MSQHWKSLLVVLVIIGAIVYFYRGEEAVNPVTPAETQETTTPTETQETTKPAEITAPAETTTPAENTAETVTTA